MGTNNMVFCFGSNLAGIHGAGAARFARMEHGAIPGVGEGMTGNCYAIPTKDHRIQTLPLEEVKKHIELFISYAHYDPEMTFQVTRIGCGLAGFKDREIAPLFKDAPKNCQFDAAWYPYLGAKYIYWGTW